MSEKSEITLNWEEYLLSKPGVRVFVEQKCRKVLQKFINGVEEIHRLNGNDYTINQSKWHELCDGAINEIGN